jgi:hypothetical protein
MKTSRLAKFKQKTSRRKVPRDIPPLANEVFIPDWKLYDDGVETSDYFRFFSDETYHRLSAEMTKDLTWTTRLGGVPTWIQSANEHPKPGMRFLGQLSEVYDFHSKIKRPPKWVFTDDSNNPESRKHYAVGPNFGGGIAYLFLESKVLGLPNVKMFSQC